MKNGQSKNDQQSDNKNKQWAGEMADEANRLRAKAAEFRSQADDMEAEAKRADEAAKALVSR